MSNQYDNTNRGAVWKNQKMREGKRDPHFTGTINVEGVDYYISAWKNDKAGDNQPVLSFSVRKDDRQQQPSYQPAAQATADVNDEIPW